MATTFGPATKAALPPSSKKWGGKWEKPTFFFTKTIAAGTAGSRLPPTKPKHGECVFQCCLRPVVVMSSFVILLYHSKDEASQKRKRSEEDSLARQRDEYRSWENGLQKGELAGDAGDSQSQSDEDDPDFVAGADLEEDARVSGGEFPSLPTRTSRNKLNESIARTFCECISEFNISEEHARGFFVKVANGVFNQNWKLESDFGAKGLEPADGTGKKRRRVDQDLSHRFPAAQTFKKWLCAAHIASLRHAGEALKDRGDDVVATFGFDDTRKAAGFRVHDVKTSHISLRSVADPLYRQTFTLGLLANVKHTGTAGGESLRHSFKGLGVLCGEGQQEVQDLFDFFQSDRGPDADPALDELGIDADRRLKCCPHMLLCIEEAVDKVFREHEGRIGVSKLLEVQSTRWNVASKSTSILTLVQIAYSKLLSPSHANGTISLYASFSTLRIETLRTNSKGSLATVLVGER